MTKTISPIFFFIVASTLAQPTAMAETTHRYQYEWFGVEDPSQELFLCVLLPYENCRGMIEARIGYGGGRGFGAGLQPGEANEYMQFYIDGGYLFRVLDRPSLQIGPTIGMEIEIFDETLRYHLYTSALLRIWTGRWITFDTSIGLVGSFSGEWRPRGVGGIGELAITLHGHLGFYVQTQVISASDRAEILVTGGFRGSLVAWLVIIAGIAG